MELKELRQKSATALESHLIVLHKEQFSLRMQKATGQLGPTHQIRRVRREIARVNTLLGAADASLVKPVKPAATKPQPTKRKAKATPSKPKTSNRTPKRAKS